MHDEILNADQLKLLPLMAQFRREYYLVGGTAIALHIGHRRSVDFDLFKMSAINHKKNVDKIVAAGFAPQITRRVAEQMNLLVNGVKLTFFQYRSSTSSKRFHVAYQAAERRLSCLTGFLIACVR